MDGESSPSGPGLPWCLWCSSFLHSLTTPVRSAPGAVLATAVLHSLSRHLRKRLCHTRMLFIFNLDKLKKKWFCTDWLKGQGDGRVIQVPTQKQEAWNSDSGCPENARQAYHLACKSTLRRRRPDLWYELASKTSHSSEL